MPKDGVQNRTFKDAFNAMVRFEIPFFQRGYAWKKGQWDQLFLDLQEQVIEEIKSGSPIDQVEHFFGPIVVLEKTGGDVDLKEFLVIDGQQRITTVYLLLAIIQEQLRAKKHLSSDALGYAEKLDRYVQNSLDSPDDYRKLKVFSSKGDRLATYRVVFGSGLNPKTSRLQTDLQLYIPGENRVDEFKKYAAKKLKADYPDVPSLWQLAQVLLNCLKIVWIPLDQAKDDPQAIFESLNDKGMPLTASELLCNFLFQPIIKAKEEYEELHNEKWLGAIRLLDGDNRFEEYLRHLFSIGENRMVGKHRKVYVHFKSKNGKLTATSARRYLSEIHAGTFIYRTMMDPISNPHKNEEINKLLIAIGNTRMETCTPFVLSVLRANTAATLSDEDTCGILRETLVLLVRRKMTELATTQYDIMFPQLLGHIVDEPNQIRALHERFKKHSVWISDQEFEDALRNKSAYRRNDLAFSRMLLMEIDKTFQSHGQLPDYSTVNSIEHVIPQVLNDAWTSYLAADAADEQLPDAIQTIGNLCLLSAPANSTVGRNPFEAKKAVYSEVTALARQIKEYQSHWGIQAIRDRSKRLATAALKVWSWAES